MRTQKNQIASAELMFSYEALKRPFYANEAKSSTNFLMQIFSKSLPTKECEFYVLFVNKQCKAFCWYRLPENAKADVFAQQIAGLAVACNAYGVIIFNCCNMDKISISNLDALFIDICFKACERAGIEIIDYVVCTPTTHFSFRDYSY